MHESKKIEWNDTDTCHSILCYGCSIRHSDRANQQINGQTACDASRSKHSYIFNFSQFGYVPDDNSCTAIDVSIADSQTVLYNRESLTEALM